MEVIIEEPAALIKLEDGTVFQGVSFGYPQSASGEIVFCTGMAGYPESLSDPSYLGQILVFTYPLIGNYGMPDSEEENQLSKFYESDGAKISGVVCADYSANYSHWNSSLSLAQWLYNQKIPAISGIDTRSLTRRLREKGTMLGSIVINEQAVDKFDPAEHNLVKMVSCKAPKLYGTGDKRILLIDCGSKYNIIRELIKRGFEVLAVPWDYPVRDETFDGLLISNGPGDPKQCKETIKSIQYSIEKNIPAFGICLGNQILALAAGADTSKMKYGHRSQNQPVQNLQSKQCFVTTQNHGYVVDENTLPKNWKMLYQNLNDGTCEGLIHDSGLFFSVQFHPEAAPGPVDTSFLFDQFAGLIS